MKNIKKSLPPVIRVFLSSTFGDMDKERSYFNEVLVPKITRICADRGVSFFSVDLRWGITEEEQIDGKVLPICLSEIDKCRPYFIGILGNRYGSILRTLPEKVGNTIPWLVGKEGHSITELEMLYAVLDHSDEETLSNCAFYLRSDNLTEQLYGHLVQEDSSSFENLKKLKQAIEEDPNKPSSRYNSIEEFGSFVMRDILNWLDRHFPESDDIDAIRCEWYNSEILRNHSENTEFNSFLDSYISESKKPLLIYGDGARGKTASLTAWEPKGARKILINCGANDKFTYWPAIAEEVINNLAEIAEETGDSQTLSTLSEVLALIHRDDSCEKSGEKTAKADLFLTESLFEEFRRRFVQCFSTLDPKEETVIVINDLNLLEDQKSKLLCWLPSSNHKSIKFICSTNDDETVESVKMIGWNIKEMPLFDKARAEHFVKEYLGSFGKSFSSSQLDKIIGSEAAQYPGLLGFVFRFLINHGRFENLDTLVDKLSDCTEIQQLYHFIYDFLMAEHSSNEQKIVRAALSIVYPSKIPLVEKECFELVRLSCDVTPIEWANVCRALEQFEIIQGDYWTVKNEETFKFIDGILSKEEKLRAEEALGDFSLARLSEYQQEGKSSSFTPQRKYAKTALLHYQNACSWVKLEAALKNRIVLEALYMNGWSSIRSAWMHLFLYSDVNLAESISETARIYLTKEEYYNKKIGRLLIGTLIDFEFENEARSLCDSLSIDVPGGTIDSSSAPISRSFLNADKKIRMLKGADDSRQLHKYVLQEINSENDYNEMDYCQLLFTKFCAEHELAYYEEALETANEYYRLTLKMGFFFEMRRAISLRSSALFRLGKYDEVIQISQRTMSIALNEGEIRSYLGALNFRAMIDYHTENYDVSVAAFDVLYKYWSKIGDLSEMTNTVINRCNALCQRGDNKEALTALEEWYEKICDIDSLQAQTAMILGNIGFYAFECNEGEKAEKYLQKTVEIAKKGGYELTLYKAYTTLINLYTKSYNIAKKHEVYKEKLELLWKRREFDLLIENLKKHIDELLILKHTQQAAEIEKYWKSNFATLENGLEYFESRTNTETLDSVSLEALREQLIIAKSEGDREKIVLSCTDLATSLKDTRLDEAIDYILLAIDVVKTQTDKTAVKELLATAFSFIFEEGVPKSENLLSKILWSLEDETFTEIANLWQSCPSCEEIDTYEILSRITSYAPEYDSVAAMALKDLKKIAVNRCTAEQLIALVYEITEEESRTPLATEWGDLMLKNLHKNNAKLIEDYTSSEAAELISYFEKCIAFLQEFDKPNAAVLAGNIAIIFRRREEKDKTIYYHNLSMQIFSEENKTVDCLIEMTNLATAYDAFGETDKAIDLLREALIKATEADTPHQRACIADNLAELLRKRKAPEDKNEIIKCFAIGENFFRTGGYTRDLAISLINQLLFLSYNEPLEVWGHILKELTDIVRKNQFNEFEEHVSYFELIAKRKKANAN